MIDSTFPLTPIPSYKPNNEHTLTACSHGYDTVFLRLAAERYKYMVCRTVLFRSPSSLILPNYSTISSPLITKTSLDTQMGYPIYHPAHWQPEIQKYIFSVWLDSNLGPLAWESSALCTRQKSVGEMHSRIFINVTFRDHQIPSWPHLSLN